MTKKAKTEAEDYVGYGHPPKHTRFKKGQSGNPAGRRKGSRNLASLVMAIADEKVAVVENGKRTWKTKKEIAVTQMFNKAAKGEDRSIKLMLQVLDLAEQREEAKAPEPQSAAQRKAADAEILKSLRRRLLDQGEDD